MISAWAAHAPATQIAAIYEISDSTVRLYVKEVLKADLPPPDLDHLRTLLVDEKAVRRRHNYVTIVLNGDSGELLYMAEGKKREVLLIASLSNSIRNKKAESRRSGLTAPERIKAQFKQTCRGPRSSMTAST